MLFHTTFTPKVGTTTEDQAAMLQLWAKWTPPEGFEIKSFHISAEGEGFVITEAESAEALMEVTFVWGGAILDYKVVPVVEVEGAVQLLGKALAYRESAL
jgi:hypothetical protein